MTMDAKTKTALLASIAKWQANARAEALDDVKMSVSDCPLCRMYHPRFGGQGNCEGCPISARTGEPYCHGTPYKLAIDAECEWSMSVITGSADVSKHKARFQTAAQDMADFLTDLLPGGEQ